MATLEAVAPDPVITLTSDHIGTELLQDVMLSLEQVATSLSVLAVNVPTHPEQSPRVRMLLETCWRTFRTVRSSWGLMP